jgi:hypothetical protein
MFRTNFDELGLGRHLIFFGWGESREGEATEIKPRIPLIPQKGRELFVKSVEFVAQF